MNEIRSKVEGGRKWEVGMRMPECGSGKSEYGTIRSIVIIYLFIPTSEFQIPKSLYLIPCTLNLKPKIYLQHAANIDLS
jgi:hypothetical protein